MTLTRLALILALVLPLTAHPKSEDDPLLGVETLAFTPAEMLRFDIPAWLDDHAPELAPYASAIGHWSAYYHISPKTLVTLMKHQADPHALVPDAITIDPQRPFGALSHEAGFRPQLIDVASRLSREFHPVAPERQARTPEARVQVALTTLLRERYPDSVREEVGRFAILYTGLFPGGPGQEPPTALPRAEGAEGDGIAFQFPWPVGEAWRGGGSHSSRMQSLDFLGGNHDWGSENVFDYFVAAANGGTVRVWSDCGVSVIDPTETWVSDYYHLENILVSDLAEVAQDDHLANYADDEETATCEGGSSTGPHVHFSIKKDDRWQPIHNRVLSSFRVHMVSDTPYDTDCEVSYYDPLNGDPKVCPWQALANTGAQEAPTFVLTVNSGDGDGEYVVGAVVEVSADEADSGFEFDGWSGDTGGLANAEAPNTSFTMGDENAEITATYVEVVDPLYTLEVIRGSGDGEYTAGTEVEIAADTPDEGMEFDRWTGNTDNIENIEAAATVLVMPDANIEIAANYREVAPEKFLLSVTDGTGDGEYAAGTEVEIVANEPGEGMEFDRWTGDTEHIDNVEAAATVLTMPEANTEVAATYRETGPTLFELDVIRGSGDGAYEAGSRVQVVADAPEEGKRFERWIGNTDHLDDPGSSTTMVTMPDAHIEIAATYETVVVPGDEFELVVVNGSGSGVYKAGDRIRVEADPAEEGMSFDRWVGNIDGLYYLDRSSTLYTMPAHDAELAATYREIPEAECQGGPDFDDDGINDECGSEVAALTGSWFDPASAGEGFMIHGVTEDLAVMYFYGYDDSGDRLWLIGTSEGPFSWDSVATFRMVRVTGGRFTGFDPANINENAYGWVDVRLDDCDEGFARLRTPLGTRTLRIDRLGSVSGSPCGGGRQRESDVLTGSWFDPLSSGQGLAVHRISSDFGVVYFYGFTDAGDPLWLLGNWKDELELGGTAIIEMLQVSGGTYDEVDPDNILEEPWGTMTLEIDSCESGMAILDGLHGYQVLDLEQLAGSFGLECY